MVAKNNQVSVAVIGASGYGGAELLRLLACVAEYEVRFITADSQKNKKVTDLYPHLVHYQDSIFRDYSEIKEEISGCDLVFCSLPHGEAMKILPSVSSKLIVDLGGDFRLQDAEQYEAWYGQKHAASNELPKWVYGLCELNREQIQKASRIANPGCYPTASILSLAPLIAAGIVDKENICVSALSGTSGAGRMPSPSLHVSHVMEDVHAYKIAKHQHTPEIEQSLSKLTNTKVNISFTAHLLPMVRGIHITCDCLAVVDTSSEKMLNLYRDFYKNEYFIRIADHNPGTKEVRGANFVKIAPFYDKRLKRVIVTTVIDNLVKGAAGQAIQNANLMLGLPETKGLESLALYP